MTKLILLHGVLKRSGTNFLNQILLLNPNCVQPALKVRENWFLHHSDLLYAYSDRLFQVWSNPKWGGKDFSKEDFYSTIGEALVAYIARGIPDLPDKILLSKTPSVQHMQRNFEMFPSSKVVIITRDPRDIAASTFKSWNRPVKQTIHDWNIAAKRISNFEKHAPPNCYLLIRYEDLMRDREIWVRRCLQFLGFKEAAYPWDTLSELQVFGSSEEGTDWKVKATTPSFQPVGRWKSLPSDERQYFTHIEPSSLEYFGYSDQDGSQPLPNRAERLKSSIEVADESPSSALQEPDRYSRATKLRQALGLIAEAILGERVANYARSKLDANNRHK